MLNVQGKRVLVTGGAGFIGSKLALRLVQQGADVTVIDSLVPELGGNLFNLASLPEGAIRFEKKGNFSRIASDGA